MCYRNVSKEATLMFPTGVLRMHCPKCGSYLQFKGFAFMGKIWFWCERCVIMSAVRITQERRGGEFNNNFNTYQ